MRVHCSKTYVNHAHVCKKCKDMVWRPTQMGNIENSCGGCQALPCVQFSNLDMDNGDYAGRRFAGGVGAPQWGNLIYSWCSWSFSGGVGEAGSREQKGGAESCRAGRRVVRSGGGAPASRQASRQAPRVLERVQALTRMLSCWREKAPSTRRLEAKRRRWVGSLSGGLKSPWVLRRSSLRAVWPLYGKYNKA